MEVSGIGHRKAETLTTKPVVFERLKQRRLPGKRLLHTHFDNGDIMRLGIMDKPVHLGVDPNIPSFAVQALNKLVAPVFIG